MEISRNRFRSTNPEQETTDQDWPRYHRTRDGVKPGDEPAVSPTSLDGSTSCSPGGQPTDPHSHPVLMIQAVNLPEFEREPNTLVDFIDRGTVLNNQILGSGLDENPAKAAARISIELIKALVVERIRREMPERIEKSLKSVAPLRLDETVEVTREEDEDFLESRWTEESWTKVENKVAELKNPFKEITYKEGETLEPTKRVRHAIELIDSKPMFVKPRRYPIAFREIIKEHIEEMLKTGRMIDDLLLGVDENSVQAYMDDLIIFSESKREHKGHLENVRVRQFVLTTDASQIALMPLKAVLAQREGKDERPDAFASRKLTPVETRHSTIERELLGIVP
ncbi:hypothetical protein AAG570_009256 [Ranatra chinensis]|uniref:Reverse transcriptase/retrotransposon-derived protein RNase H-like domain-containing protein n=1 Tax=Ranatra chinensis TaxID=642074 RepID=A0ABD0Z3V1_9HEMI